MDAHHHGVMPGLAAPELAHHDHVDLPPLGTAAARAVEMPTSEKAPDAANVGGPVQTETQCVIFDQPADAGKRNESPDSRAAPLAGQALRVIEGERKAADFLARLHAQQADPDELAVILSMLYGATLRGFCRVIEKALGVHHA